MTAPGEYAIERAAHGSVRPFTWKASIRPASRSCCRMTHGGVCGPCSNTVTAAWMCFDGRGSVPEQFKYMGVTYRAKPVGHLSAAGGLEVNVAVRPLPRPIMRYHGSKWRLAPWVISHFPQHLTYVELFGGSASILLQKPRSRSEIYNDLSKDVVRTFAAIRKHPVELARALALTPYARSEYEGLYDETIDDVEAARRFIARSFMGQNSKGAFQKSGFDARNNSDHFIARVRSLAAVPDQLATVAARLTQVLFENCDAIGLAQRYAAADTLIYADPPYLEKRSYYPDAFGIQRHRDLLTVLAASPAMVVISSYPSELYSELLPGWQTVRARARTDTSSTPSARTEVLWINPAATKQLTAYQRPEGQ